MDKIMYRHTKNIIKLQNKFNIITILFMCIILNWNELHSYMCKYRSRFVIVDTEKRFYYCYCSQYINTKFLQQNYKLINIINWIDCVCYKWMRHTLLSSWENSYINRHHAWTLMMDYKRLSFIEKLDFLL